MQKSTQSKEGFDNVIVIGTSAGGLKALSQLVSQLPDNFPAPIFIVQHISPDATGDVLLDALSANTKLKCVHAKPGMRPKQGFIYVAPSDHHLLIDGGNKMLVSKGAHENRSRPAIDPLFRSAAVAFGNKVIGILLTGYLDDGTSGMKVIKRCGGKCIVQHPDDAEYPAMPISAIKNVDVDYIVPISEMGGILYQIMEQKKPRQVAVPKDIEIEAAIAERTLSDLPSVNALGVQVPFNCPGCGGVLWEIKEDKSLRYRCHTGHAFTASTLLAEQTGKIEETMWTALRMFEERKNLLSTMAEKYKGKTAEALKERVAMSQIHIDRIRAVLMADDKGTTSDIPV
jgi:two-component system chemotaxis response regulator CheB